MQDKSNLEAVRDYVGQCEWECEERGEDVWEIEYPGQLTVHTVAITCDPRGRYLGLSVQNHLRVPIELRGVLALELLRLNARHLFARYAMVDGTVALGAALLTKPNSVTPELVENLLRRLAGVADGDYPRLMKLIWSDWREGAG